MASCRRISLAGIATLAPTKTSSSELKAWRRRALSVGIIGANMISMSASIIALRAIDISGSWYLIGERHNSKSNMTEVKMTLAREYVGERIALKPNDAIPLEICSSLDMLSEKVEHR